MKEYETTNRIRHWLQETEITILNLPIEVGVFVETQGTKTGPTIALNNLYRCTSYHRGNRFVIYI